ncbi:hypothetical protein [Cyanobium sp. Lug-B]|uniref:hypothetical protein n=1 Tax=Cyanobium sp. Lug-B TaxID=2823716 RepID=UPI0020CBA0B6|nr:hypothetical protein [Cyanobium sp. Lug-B]MCP9796235.1 hypothetical protein [Cyanobium sp. Lug-B]
MRRRFLQFLNAKDDQWSKSLTAIIALMGFLWGAWTFIFKEVLTPAVAPVNISLDLEIKRLRPEPVNDTKAPGPGTAQPVLLRASARNSSRKILTIRKTFWVAYATTLPPLFGKGSSCYPGKDGGRSSAAQKAENHPSQAEVDAVKKGCEQKVISDVNHQMSLGSAELALAGTSASWYQSGKDIWDVIGFGSLFDANEIRPDEEIKAQRLVLVPQISSPNDYKILRVKVIIPSYSKRSNLADEDLIRVVGGIASPYKDFLGVGFCQAERDWRKHGVRWFFDKFALPRDGFEDTVFKEPASLYCPSLMTTRQRERIGAQVFPSVYEIPLNVPADSPSAPAKPQT